MDKLKKAILEKDRWSGLNIFINAIEENKNKDPNISLDNSKSVLESISKTILNDKDIEFKNDSSIGFLLKKSFESLPVFQKLSEKDIDSGKKILNSLSTVVVAIGEFRNEHGFFAHGQDLESKKFDDYLIDLVISSTDILASFLIISHGEDLKNRSRIYYEENEDFNNYFDEKEDWVKVVGVEYSPSKTLFHNDIESYKEELYGFGNDPNTLISALENAKNKESLIENIVDIKSILSSDNLESLNKILKQQKELYSNVKDKLESSGVLDSMNKINLILQPAVENINRISEQLRQKREFIKDEIRDEVIEEHFDDLIGQQQYEEERDKY